MIPHTITLNSITLFLEDGVKTVYSDAPNFDYLRQALFQRNWDAVPGLLTVTKGLEAWAQGAFTIANGVFCHNGAPLPTSLNDRICAMAKNGEDPTSLLKFWERICGNPSMVSKNSTFPFLEHQGIPIDQDGYILAYKAIRGNYRDVHSGKFDNRPGNSHKMPRNEVSDDTNIGCHAGFHVGSIEYAKSFMPYGGKIVVCRVDPKNVVCVPKDCSHQKMRVCEYDIIDEFVQLLPSTSVTTTSTDEGWEIDTTPRMKVKEWWAFDDLDAEELDGYSMEDLRRYASRILKISNAHGIRGGKSALLDAIYDDRGY